MTSQEAQKRAAEIALDRAILRRDQAKRHYQRSAEINSKCFGAVPREQLEDEHTTYEIALLEVEECELRLAALDAC